MQLPGNKQRAQAALYGDMALAIPFVAAAGYGIGYGLDHLAGTTWLRVIFLLLFIVGAFANLVLRVLKDGKSK